MTRLIHVIANPGAGKPQPVLHTLNHVFRAAGVDWELFLTKKAGDAERFARQSVAAGADVAAAFGGDGTVMEVARGLMGGQVPLAILPGGTANLMAVEMGISKKLDEAARIAASPDSQPALVDMGLLGDTLFLLRVGVGFGARKVAYATREMKDRFGLFAYTAAGIKALKETRPAQFRLMLDGRQVDMEGVALLVDNAGNMGVPGSQPFRDISAFDGLLDVILLKSDLSSALASSRTLLDRTHPEMSVLHWQAAEIVVQADPPQPVQVDGELAGDTPISLRIVPQAVRILRAAPGASPA